MKKSGRKWKTFKCGRCNRYHYNYSGKIDKNGVEYVVCETTNKRMNISGTGTEVNSWAYPTEWLLDI